MLKVSIIGASTLVHVSFPFHMKSIPSITSKFKFMNFLEVQNMSMTFIVKHCPYGHEVDTEGKLYIMFVYKHRPIGSTIL